MSAQPYEIELVASETDTDYHESLLATITGLPKAEIREKLPQDLSGGGGWRGSSFPRVARLLGFNVNPRFIKFDPATPWPCILRVQVPEHWGWKGKWWAVVYNQGTVYLPDQGVRGSLNQFLSLYPGCRVTSMLQIWISDL
ncbi:hypothetical protein [Hymenobacter rigui]|uniref:Uncharacterized protein n=1 Tax=Hymenobacter rigui TaxID=334424 RepID=A0A3R9MNR4_9BACT|nr:hypothetical protein [Hymenobacter rigui]RSK50087.1 hypothetical protein EI291_05400 [Hymenobacter rigui]